jgi:pimeloyl-ACP methyl ester carboxylesterase
MWRPNIKALSERFRTFAVDNIFDFGRSIHQRPLRSVDDLMGWLDELFTALPDRGRLNLIGLSYGGWLAARYALTRPERLRRVVLLAPSATVLAMRPAFWLRALVGILPIRCAHRSTTRWLFDDLARLNLQGRRLVEDAVSDAWLAARCFKTRRVVPPTRLRDEELSSLCVPTLFMTGAHERIYDPHRAVERLERVAPQVQAEVIPGAGHDLAAVKAQLVNAKIRQFLESRDPAQLRGPQATR